MPHTVVAVAGSHLPVDHKRVAAWRQVQSIGNRVIISIRVVRIGAGIGGTYIITGIGFVIVIETVTISIDGTGEW
jgi:hypothetical protein